MIIFIQLYCTGRQKEIEGGGAKQFFQMDTWGVRTKTADTWFTDGPQKKLQKQRLDG